MRPFVVRAAPYFFLEVLVSAGLVDALPFEPLEARAVRWPDPWLPVPLPAAVAIPEHTMHSDTTVARNRRIIPAPRNLLEAIGVAGRGDRHPRRDSARSQLLGQGVSGGRKCAERQLSPHSPRSRLAHAA